MVTLCWAAKGGSGTTVVATTLALHGRGPTLLVDLDGDIPAVLGLPAPDRPGVADWAASDAPAAHLADLLVEVDERLTLLPHRLAPPDAERHDPPARPSELASWLTEWEAGSGGEVAVDVGTGEPPEALGAIADRSLLVTRACFLSVSRAARCRSRPTGVVLIEEPGRSLRPREVAQAVGAPVEATVRWNHEIARAVDAGLLGSRLPRTVGRDLRRVAA